MYVAKHTETQMIFLSLADSVNNATIIHAAATKWIKQESLKLTDLALWKDKRLLI